MKEHYSKKTNKLIIVERFAILIITVLLFCGINIVIRKVNLEKYGEYSGSSEFLETIDLCEYFDEHGEGKYVLAFDLRTEKRGRVLVALYSSSGSKYKISDCYVNSSENMSHYELIIDVKEAFSESEVSPLTFHGEYGTGIIPHVRDIEIKPYE